MGDENSRPEEGEGQPVPGRIRGIFGNLDRINAFSDAVFAVAITLLVLSIRVPHITGARSNANLAHELGKSSGHIKAFALSFVIIAAFWISHHSLFSKLRRIDGAFIWMNMLCLLLVVFMPYPTVILSEYGDIQLAVILYAGTMAAMGLVMAALCWYAAKGNRLVGEDHDHEFTYNFVAAELNLALVFLVSIGISFINPVASMYFWLVLIVSGFFLARIHPFREVFKHRAAR